MENKKVVFFSFQDNEMCFMHILLNLLDLNERGIEAKLVMEGASTRLIRTLIEEDNNVFKKVMKLGLIDSVCKACANQMGVLEYVSEETDLSINGDMNGHPPVGPYVEEGYEVIAL